MTADISQALKATRARIEALYDERRSSCKSKERESPVFSSDSAFEGGWLPQDPEKDFTLPWTYRDMSLFDDPQFVKEKMFGADRAFHESLDFQSALLLKFVIKRELDIESAADRFLNFRQLIIEHDLKWSIDDPHVEKGLGAGVYFTVPVLDRQNRPVISMLVREISFKEYTFEDHKKAYFYSMMNLLSWTPTAQTEGIMICVDMTGLSWSNQLESGIRNFLTKALKHCLPIRVRHAYIANAPTFFNKIVWPIIKHLFGSKMRKLISCIGSDHEQVLKVLPPECVPEGMGGRRPLDKEATQAALPFFDYRRKDDLPSPSVLTSTIHSSLASTMSGGDDHAHEAHEGGADGVSPSNERVEKDAQEDEE